MGRRNATAAKHQEQAKDGRKATRKNARGNSVPVVRPMGRPTALTDRVEETILGLTIQGVATDAACHLAGISTATFHRWMNRGEDARATLDHTGSLDPAEDRFRDFYESVLDARAQAEERMNGIIFKAAMGGFVTSEKPVQDIQGNVQYDPAGRIIMETSTTAPDGRLAMAWLQRRRPDNWSAAVQTMKAKVEVSGAGGAPIQVEHTIEQVTDLTARLMQVRQEFERDEAAMDAVERGEGDDGAYDVTSLGDAG